ncbi:MAG: hypothetical protein HQM15_11725 [Deltaproteobacteria bacterium]|nr:hypothetical protein [Deltaproteobacteria bacterium]
MNIIRRVMLGSFLVVAVLASPLHARAADVRIGIGLPLFYPEPEFRYDQGYYRTRDNHYYHYDEDRRGWHYGRSHKEGLKEEERRLKRQDRDLDHDRHHRRW